MNEKKRARIAAAVTVNVIILIVILAAVAIYQLIYLSNLKAKRSEIQDEIARLEQETSEESGYLNWLQSDAALQQAIQEQVIKNKSR